jgi:hypothetical protein
LKNNIPLDSIPDFYQEPTTYAPFLYDAIWSLGKSMCEAEAEAAQVAGETNGDVILSGPAIMKEFKNLDFIGTSGSIQISESASRTKNDFVVWNMKEQPQQKQTTEENGDDSMISYGIYPAPPSLPDIDEDFNYIGNVGRGIAYIPMVIIMVCSIVSFFWMCWYRQERAIRSAQPLFLCMISLGSLITVSTIIPMGLDEEMVASQHGLNVACQAVPWLYVIGSCCSYSALTAKVRGVYEVRKVEE